jgi:hypothetical protein
MFKTIASLFIIAVTGKAAYDIYKCQQKSAKLDGAEVPLVVFGCKLNNVTVANKPAETQEEA